MTYFDIHSINVLKDRTSACITMNSCSIYPNIFEYKQLPRLANERAPTKGSNLVITRNPSTVYVAVMFSQMHF